MSAERSASVEAEDTRRGMTVGEWRTLLAEASAAPDDALVRTQSTFRGTAKRATVTWEASDGDA